MAPIPLPECAAIVAAKGADSKYARDCAVRAVRDLPFAQALAALGMPADSPEIIIHAGIGTLVMRPGSAEFTSAPTLAAKAAGLAGAVLSAAAAALTGGDVLAAPAEIERRRDICASCPLWVGADQRCGACGCSTPAKTSMAASTCPRGHW